MLLPTVGQYKGFLRWFSGKESACRYRRCKRRGFDSWVRKIPWSRKWYPTPVSLPGKEHGQGSLVVFSHWGPKGVRHDLTTKQHHSMLEVIKCCEKELVKVD